MTDRASCLYVGRVRHRRYGDTPHAFSYGLYQLFLDLDELPELFRDRLLWSYEKPNVVSFRREDYLGDADVPLDVAVRDEVERKTGRRPSGPIRLLTHLRTFGISFNPVSFYYCYADDGTALEAIVAEITNTPWRERHRYVLAPSRRDQGKHLLRFRFGKDFHISPFQPMELDYDWRFTEPGERLAVHMRTYDEGERTFDATLAMERRPLTGTTLAQALLQHPWISVEVLAGIYKQALALWWKGARRHVHPRKRATRLEGSVR